MQGPPKGGPAPAGDAAPAPADSEAPGTPMMFWIWGLFSGWLTGAGYLTYAAYYTTYTDTLYDNRSGGGNSAWTKAYIQETDPVKMWIYSSYAAMGMQGFQTLFWLFGVLGMKGMFMMVFKLGMLFPLIELGMWGYTYSLYSACSAVTDTQFDGSTSSVTQTVSCKNASENSTTTGKFGTSGTVAKKVSEDPYITWFAANVGSATAMIWLNMLSKGSFAKAFSGKKGDDDAAADADAAPADAAAPATPAAPAKPASPAKPAAPADSAPKDNNSEPKGPGAGGNKNNQGFGNGADWNQPTNEPEPTPEPEQKCGYWGCL